MAFAKAPWSINLQCSYTHYLFAIFFIYWFHNTDYYAPMNQHWNNVQMMSFITSIHCIKYFSVNLWFLCNSDIFSSHDSSWKTWDFKTQSQCFLHYSLTKFLESSTQIIWWTEFHRFEFHYWILLIFLAPILILYLPYTIGGQDLQHQL